MRPSILIDLGGVLAHMPRFAEAWGARFGMTTQEFLTAVYAGSDDTVLIGAVTEGEWWRIVAGRLGVTADVIDEMHQDMAAKESWDEALVALLRTLRAPRGARGLVRTAVVSNAWPETRARLRRDGMLDLVDELVISAEVGCAKPDPRIFEIALDRVGARPGDALFIDDTPGHVAAAQALGIAGHVHTDSASTIEAIQDFLAKSSA